MESMKSIKSVKYIFLLGPVGFLLIFLKVCLVFTGAISPSRVFYIDADSKDNIYLGTKNEITVIADGEELRKIRLDKRSLNDGYYFYIKNDEVLVDYVSENRVVRFDSQGMERPAEDVNFEEIVEGCSEKLVLKNGHSYELHKNLGLLPYTVTRDGELIYRMEALDYIFNGPPYFLLFSILCIIFAVWFPAAMQTVMECKKNGEDIFDVIWRD